MRVLAERRPLTFVIVVLLILQLFVLLALLYSQVTGVAVITLDLPLLLLNALFAGVLVSNLGWWREVGFNVPRAWKNLRLLAMPALLLTIPTLLLRPQLPALSMLTPLIIITLLIGFQEEIIFRGVILRALMPLGVMQSVLISALLFAVIHANSFLVGRDPLFVMAQIVASFLGGIGLAALWIRLRTIVPLIVLHAVNDFLQFSATGGLEAQAVAVYIPVLKIIISGLMAVYGLYLLRRYFRHPLTVGPVT
jgi:uncharacterized protein